MAKRFIFSLSLLMVALVVTIAYHYYKPTPPLNDTIEYQYAADNLLKNNILYGGNSNQPVDYRLYSKRTLGYPIFLLFQQQQLLDSKDLHQSNLNLCYQQVLLLQLFGEK